MWRAAITALAIAAGTGTTFATPRVDLPLASPSVIVIDATSGAVLFERRADELRPIASMTKLFAALALRRRVDFRRSTTITADDVHASVGGAQSPLREGQTFDNLDLLDAMLLSSDNRVPTALARSIGWSPADLLVQMTTVVRDLGLAHTRFDDVTGLSTNASTAREMALALREAIRDPMLRRAMTTKRTHIISKTGESSADYTSTIAPLWDDRHRVVGGKTGWTEAAGYCEVVAVEVSQKTIVIALLGARVKAARYDDYIAIVDWLERATSSRAPASRPRASASR